MTTRPPHELTHNISVFPFVPFVCFVVQTHS